MRVFAWNAEKNALLAATRGITFEEVVSRIEAGARVVETEHPNKVRYPHLRVLIVEIDDYAYIIPCVVSDETYFMKTVIPSRKATRTYLGGNV